MAIYKIKVSCGCKENKIIDRAGCLYLKTTAKPINHEANKKIVEMLSEYWSVPKSLIKIRSGNTSREKLIEILQEN